MGAEAWRDVLLWDWAGGFRQMALSLHVRLKPDITANSHYARTELRTGYCTGLLLHKL